MADPTPNIATDTNYNFFADDSNEASEDFDFFSPDLIETEEAPNFFAESDVDLPQDSPYFDEVIDIYNSEATSLKEFKLERKKKDEKSNLLNAIFNKLQL